jgi:hypothetical protein
MLLSPGDSPVTLFYICIDGSLFMNRSLLKAIPLVLLISLASAQPALAYIDPNTGGILFQALAASFAVISGVILIFSRQIRNGFARARRRLRERHGVDEPEGEQESTD